MWFLFVTLSNRIYLRCSIRCLKVAITTAAIALNIATRIQQHQDKLRFYVTLETQHHYNVREFNKNVFIPFYLSKIMTPYYYILCTHVMLYAYATYTSFSFTSCKHFIAIFEKYITEHFLCLGAWERAATKWSISIQIPVEKSWLQAEA